MDSRSRGTAAEQDKTETVTFDIPPFPQYTISYYREFLPGESHITRKFGEYVLLIMMEGELHFTEEGKEVNLRAGEWYLQRPHMLQSANRPSDLPRYYFLHFAVPAIDETGVEPAPCRFVRQQITMPIRGKCDYRLYLYYFRILALFPLLGALDVLHVQKVFLEFFKFFLETAGIETCRSQSRLVQDMVRYIQENYAEERLMERLAAQFHYSADYIRRRFLKETGSTPTAYLTLVRIERAKQLLTVTDYAVEEIAARVGYGDPSVFYRNFRKLCQCNPSDWRRHGNILAGDIDKPLPHM